MKSPQVLRFILVVAAFLTTLGARPASSELRFGGFTDFTLYTNDDSSAASNSGFKEGQFVLHLNSSLGDRLSFFAEITWTPRSSGFGTEIERSILKYAYRDAFMPSLGRYHTPISWWNVAYHHGTWLQTTVDRPVAVRFGSTFIPIHFVGAMAEGKFFSRGLTLSYAAGVGNGRHEDHSRGGDAGDADNHRATIVQLGLRPDALYDLEVGGAAYFDRVPMVQGDDDAGEQIYSAYLVLTRETPEIIGEFFYVRHDDDASEEEYDDTSWYLQMAYRLPIWGQRLKPYGRVEQMDTDDDPVYAGTEPDLHRYLAGLRFDFAAMAALKFEARRYRADQREWVNEFFTAANIVF